MRSRAVRAAWHAERRLQFSCLGPSSLTTDRHTNRRERTRLCGSPISRAKCAHAARGGGVARSPPARSAARANVAGGACSNGAAAAAIGTSEDKAHDDDISEEAFASAAMVVALPAAQRAAEVVAAAMTEDHHKTTRWLRRAEQQQQQEALLAASVDACATAEGEQNAALHADAAAAAARVADDEVEKKLEKAVTALLQRRLDVVTLQNAELSATLRTLQRKLAAKCNRIEQGRVQGAALVAQLVASSTQCGTNGEGAAAGEQADHGAARAGRDAPRRIGQREAARTPAGAQQPHYDNGRGGGGELRAATDARRGSCCGTQRREGASVAGARVLLGADVPAHGTCEASADAAPE
jgi:hypothetical protein